MSEIIFPNYDNCILNTISSILKYYNVPTKHKSLPQLDERLKRKYKNVVLLILDGMGEHILKDISPDGLFRKNEITCVTSVYPSTTTAALTTYYSGKPPYETGWIGWSQYFKEYGRAIDMFKQKESYLGDSLNKPRINVFDSIVNYESVFKQIEKASPDVVAYEINPQYAEKKSTRTITANSLEEICDELTKVLKNDERKFIMAYSDNPDGLLHKYGCKSVEVANMIKKAEEKIEELVKELSEDTILIISADHGHKDIKKIYSTIELLELQECLIMPPSLESRSVAFWVHEDKKERFEEIFNRIFKDEFLLLTKDEVLEKHILGYGDKHPKIDDFIGNYMALSISGSIIRLETFLAEGKEVKKSTHCGLTKEEMEVPVIVF